jgi:hypothetical protein
MTDTSLDTEVEQMQAEQRSSKGPCAACDAAVCEFD